MKQPQTILDKALKERNKAIQKTFLAEWNPAQFKAMQRAISRHFSITDIRTNKGEYPAKYRSFEALDEILGLAYTSSSSFAGYWVCNVDIYGLCTGFRYVGFAMTEAGRPYAILWDAEENEIIRNI